MSAGVKQYLSTLLYALEEERHFALVVGLRFPTRARFESFGSGTRSDPAISSITHCDQDSVVRTPLLAGSGMPNHYVGAGLHTIGMSGLSRVSVWACGPLNLMKISSSKCRIGQARSGETE